ncbi:phytolongin Phyl1.1 [Gastrolobium bilobum]|uniref:phytolongin Phyl1.1 n=1 Tax=Gastrolobium bilobum TaxID=150636 RepID=UPI002AB0C216|nr:phytolongin Phyl1.1 [Gastrolobium bilobum]XP_061354165.1 phytolongin Phyl1.1 [Gastrolobium bilobum]XP_061354167.1 phytolongin Phyl1.1 [Gastrolobium bilobum]XP_061354168.1 phytolongin Phyl1.1 [Gastrolobium bilobum]
MDSIQNKVYYCCVSKGNNVLYAYSGGDQGIENVAALCLERAPPFHRWYFETIGKRTYGFFMEDGYVYFGIIDEGLGNSVLLRFLEHVRDEFRKLARKGSRGILPNMNSIYIQEKLVPVIHSLITSLENVSNGSSKWRDETSSSLHVDLSPSPSNLNGQIESASSTKAPLLGKSSKPEKKKVKDHVIAMRDVELEEHRKSTERGARADSGNMDCISQGGAGASVLQKDVGSMRTRSSPQNIRRKWWSQVRIVLAIDAAVCIILFVIWLVICHGLSCIR